MLNTYGRRDKFPQTSLLDVQIFGWTPDEDEEGRREDEEKPKKQQIVILSFVSIFVTRIVTRYARENMQIIYDCMKKAKCPNTFGGTKKGNSKGRYVVQK